jgi:hypothetical protein
MAPGKTWRHDLDSVLASGLSSIHANITDLSLLTLPNGGIGGDIVPWQAGRLLSALLYIYYFLLVGDHYFRLHDKDPGQLPR